MTEHRNPLCRRESCKRPAKSPYEFCSMACRSLDGELNILQKRLKEGTPEERDARLPEWQALIEMSELLNRVHAIRYRWFRSQREDQGANRTEVKQ